MIKKYFTVEEVAPVLGYSPIKLRNRMRDGVIDLGIALDPKKTGKSTWEFRIFPAKLEKLTGSSIEELMGIASDDEVQRAKMAVAEVLDVPVEMVAELMHKDADFVRDGLQQGVFPWGYAVNSSTTSEWEYYISSVRLA